ncbi:MAG: hypothetical protein Q4F08_10030, partial [Rikenellaceae bacterium]|nr:hypothetical protein [Rikenellaceae bacterium]
PQPAIVAFDTAALAEPIAVPYGTQESEIGLPAALTATFADGTSAEVAVTWACIGDGLGGAAYNPAPEDPTAVLFTFRAALAEAIPCEAEMPQAQVALVVAPMLMAANEEPDPKQYGIYLSTSTPTGEEWFEWWYADDGSVKGVDIFNAEVTLSSPTIPIHLVGATAYLYGGKAEHKISVQSVAKLDVSNCQVSNLEVHGGTVSIADGTIQKLHVEKSPDAHLEVTISGSATVNNATLIDGNVQLNGKLGTLTMNGGELTIGQAGSADNITANGGTIENKGTIQSITGGCELHAGKIGTAELTSGHIDSATSINSLVLDGASCQLTDTTIDSLEVRSLPESGNVYTLRANIGTLTLSKEVGREVAERNAEDALNVYYSQTPTKEKTVSDRNISTDGQICLLDFDEDSVQYIFTSDGSLAAIPDAGQEFTCYSVKITFKDKTVFEGPITLTAKPLPIRPERGTITKEYDGTTRFANVKLENPTYTLSTIRTGVTYNPEDFTYAVFVNAESESADAGEGSSKIPWSVANPNDFSNFEMNAVFALHTVITTKAATLSGTITRSAATPVELADVAGQESWNAEGLVAGEDKGDLGDVQLLDADGRDLLKAELEPDTTYTVTSITSVKSNYTFTPQKLSVRTLKAGDGTIAIEGWRKGDDPKTPETNSKTHTAAPAIAYAKAGTDPKTDEGWQTEPPTEIGSWVVRAVWSAEGEYGTHISTANFAITVDGIDWSQVHWNYTGPISFTDSFHQVELVGLPEDIKVKYSGDYRKKQKGSYTATVTFPEGVDTSAIPDELKSLQWSIVDGTTIQMNWKAVNCSVKVTPWGGGEEIQSSGERTEASSVKVTVSNVPEGYKMVVFASTNSSYSAIAEQGKISGGQPNYTIEFQNVTDAYYLLAAAVKTDLPKTLVNEVTLYYHPASEDGSKPAYWDEYDLTQAFAFDPNVPYVVEPSYSGAPKPEIDGTTLRVDNIWWENSIVLNCLQGLRTNSGSSHYYTKYNISDSGDVRFKLDDDTLEPQPNFAGSVTLSSAYVGLGQTISGILDDPNNEAADMQWQWQRSTDDGATWTDIDGATDRAYTTTQADVNGKLRLQYTLNAMVKQTKEATVTDGSAPTFTITIPAAVSLNDTNSLTIACTEFNGDGVVDVTVSSANNFKLTSGENAVSYTLKCEDGSTLTQGGKAFSFRQTGEREPLTFTIPEGQNAPAGTYTDTLTFIASLIQ